MKVLAFGDSFVKMFLHCQPEVKHWKFKGKSVRGLVKEEDLDRRKIEREVRKTPSGTKILMFFGQVDFNYVRYYKIIKGEPPITEETFKKYVQWVSSMNSRKNISIVSIFPSPVKKQNIISSLINKGSYLPEQQTPELDARILAEYENSPQTWQRWNSYLALYCSKYHIDNIRLFKQNHLEPQFYDISGLTIHLRYVPVLKLVKNYVDITFDAVKAEEIQKLYEKEKVDRISNSIFRIGSKEESIGDVDKHQQISESKEEHMSVVTEQCEVLKNVRKRTADLDTDTHIQKQSQKSRQLETALIQKQLQPNTKRSVSNQSTKSKQAKKKQKKVTKKAKSAKEKQKEKEKEKEKGKKKYVCVEKSQSQDQGEVFLQLANKGKKRY